MTAHLKPGLRQAITEAMRGHYRIESLVASQSLEQICIDVGRLLQMARLGQARSNEYPVFCLLHLIEACAFSSRIVGRTPVPDQLYRGIPEAILAASEPIDRYLLDEEKSLGLWLRRIERQQMMLQPPGLPISMGRCVRLLGAGSPLHASSPLLQGKHGFSIEDWLCVHAMLWAMTYQAPNPSLRSDWIEAIPPESIERTTLLRCLDLVCHTRRSVSAHYTSQRPSFVVGAWANPTSAFLVRPCIRFEEGISTPVPGLLVHHAVHGLRALLRSIGSPQVDREFSDALERYATQLIGATGLPIRVVAGSDLKRALAPSRSCDGLWEFDDCVLLLECKSFLSPSRTLDPSWLRESTETSELVHGLTQIQETAAAVREGRLPSVSVNKPIIGIVLTVQECGIANVPDYFRTIIKPVLNATQSDVARRGESQLAYPAAVFSLDAIDYLAMWMATRRRGPVGAFSAYDGKTEMMRGAWDRFLATEIRNDENPLADFWHAPFEELIARRFSIHERTVGRL